MTSLTRVAVIGGGAWGTTVASLVSAKADTTLWTLEGGVASAINDRHENTSYLPGAALDPALVATADLGRALDGADVVLMAVPSQHFRTVLVEARAAIGPATPFVSLTKGIEAGSLLRMSQVAADVLDGHDPGLIGVVSGPNVARQVIAGDPAATVLALPDSDCAAWLQDLLMTPALRVYTNPDVIGCEIGGAVKNVVALAAGMAAGLGFGENTIATLVTRGLAELTRLGVALGGEALTFLGLAGIGDLVATCHSDGSRNRTVGEALAQGRPLEEILAGMHSVAEGVRSCPSVLELGRRSDVELPICEQVGSVLDGVILPAEAVDRLMHRDAKAELDGIIVGRVPVVAERARRAVRAVSIDKAAGPDVSALIASGHLSNRPTSGSDAAVVDGHDRTRVVSTAST